MASQGTPGSTPDMAAYIALPEAGKPVLSADGGLLAFLCNLSGSNQVWTCPMQDGCPAGPPRQLTDLPERVIAIAFAPKGCDLIFTTDRGMDERFQIGLIPDAEGAPRLLTQAPGRVHQWGAWGPEADRIAFTANTGDPRRMGLQVLDLATGAMRGPWQGEGFAEALAFAPDGRVLVRDSRRSMRDQELLWVDPATGATEAILPHDGPVQYVQVRLDKDGAGAFVLTDQGGDVTRPCRLDFATGDLAPVYEVPGWEIEKIVLNPARDRIACLVNREGLVTIEMLDPATGQTEAIGAPGEGQINDLIFAGDGGRVIFDFAGPSQPGDLWSWHRDEGFRRLGLLPAQATPTGHVRAQLHRIDSFDGLSVPFFAYTPQGPRPDSGWPVLFLIHGGPESQWKAQFRPDIAWYLDRGIMVVAPNVRGSSGYGRAYCALDDRERRMDSVRDLLAIRDHIAARPDTDATRIGVMGQSYGGFMVLAALIEAPDAFACGVDLYGVSNFTTMMATTGPWRMVLRAAEYGDPITQAAMLHELSPMTRITRITAPLLVVHCTEDPRVAIEQGEQVHAALRGHDRPVEILRIENEGHGFSRKPAKTRAFQTIAGFLARNL